MYMPTNVDFDESGSVLPALAVICIALVIVHLAMREMSKLNKLVLGQMEPEQSTLKAAELGSGGRKFTQEHVSAMSIEVNGVRHMPKGYYSDGILFGENDQFPDGCVFGNDSVFGSGCVFGDKCRFGQFCIFESFCTFGYANSFGIGCIFGVGCVFGDWCAFAMDCTFAETNSFGKNCGFALGCLFRGNSFLDPSCRVEQDYMTEQEDKDDGRTEYV